MALVVKCPSVIVVCKGREAFFGTPEVVGNPDHMFFDFFLKKEVDPIRPGIAIQYSFPLPFEGEEIAGDAISSLKIRLYVQCPSTFVKGGAQNEMGCLNNRYFFIVTDGPDVPVVTQFINGGTFGNELVVNAPGGIELPGIVETYRK
jgi:hypothetical protein